MDSKISKPINCYTKGDTFDTGSVSNFTGILTGSNKSIYFTIPLDKPILGVTGATLTAMNGSFRGISGYVDGGDKNWLTPTTDYSIVAPYINPHEIRMRVNFTNALSTTNNTPVIFTGNITLTFT